MFNLSHRDQSGSAARPPAGGFIALIVAVGQAWLVAWGLIGLGASAWAAAPVASVARSEPGLIYTNEFVARVPWSIHVLKIDRAQADLTLFSAHAKDKVLAVSLVADQARAVPREIGRALGGVNGDFYVRDAPIFVGDPRGLQIVNGELISGPDTVCVWLDTNGNPQLDEVKSGFTITWPGGRKIPFGLNQRREARMAVLYTPTLGGPTRTKGGCELTLEKSGDGPWLPLQAGQTYRARVRNISTNGDSRIMSTTAMILSLGPNWWTAWPGFRPGPCWKFPPPPRRTCRASRRPSAAVPPWSRMVNHFCSRVRRPGWVTTTPSAPSMSGIHVPRWAGVRRTFIW